MDVDAEYEAVLRAHGTRAERFKRLVDGAGHSMLAQGECPGCGELGQRIVSCYAQADAGRWPRGVKRRLDALDCIAETWEDWHRQIGQLDRVSNSDRAQYVHVRWMYRAGCAALVEPRAGVTELSKTFYCVHRRRFGRFVGACMRDDEQTLWPLILRDQMGRYLLLSGCSAGYGDEGPAGTLWLLRMAGFPDGPREGGSSLLERLVRGHRAFLLFWAPGDAQPAAVLGEVPPNVPITGWPVLALSDSEWEGSADSGDGGR